MKKNNKKIFIIGIIILIIAIIAIISYNILKDENKLTVDEKKWVNSNSGTMQNVKVINNINNFAVDGAGVFFDFLNDFGKNYNLKINPITYNKNESNSGLAFKVSTQTNDNDLVFFKDHFVLVSANDEIVKSAQDFNGRKIGILKEYISFAKDQLSMLNNVELVEYEKVEELLSALKSGEAIKCILVPKNEYIDMILKNDLKINFHLGDVNLYYSLQIEADKPLSSVMKKYYKTWIKNNLDESFNKQNLKLYIDALEISKKDQDTLTSKVYNYGFIDNSPYEVITGGNYGGIVSTYLKSFSDFSDVEFKFIKYKNINALNSAISNKDIDLYFNINESASDFKTVPSLLNINFSIIAKKENYITINSLKSLENEKIYVLENSILASYLKGLKINIETFKTYKDVFKLLKKDILIALDSNVYNFYKEKEFKDYSLRYNETINHTYNFKVNVNDTFYKLFAAYTNALDSKEMTNIGLHNHELTLEKGSFFSRIAQYLLGAIVVIGILGFILYKYSKRIVVGKKIKKEDKMRFIDQLTSLKNRNYLSENIENWNKNTIYPQGCIIMDLNSVQEINDTLGYDQGDAQIKAAANILIKTQLDNSDIIRTDGNEFLIYTIGYQEKQIVSYIRKLYKELKNLPFDYGAAMGYSMIVDDLKTIEDAINEAVEDMRIKKEEAYEE